MSPQGSPGMHAHALQSRLIEFDHRVPFLTINQGLSAFTVEISISWFCLYALLVKVN